MLSGGAGLGKSRRTKARGWGSALCRHDKNGQQLWATKLPGICIGMDAIPDGGVMLGCYEKAVL
jgi:hypothetical protein